MKRQVRQDFASGRKVGISEAVYENDVRWPWRGLESFFEFVACHKNNVGGDKSDFDAGTEPAEATNGLGAKGLVYRTE